MVTKTPKRLAVAITKASIRHTVATSTAIETGQDAKWLEKQLENKNKSFSHVKLAPAKSY